MSLLALLIACQDPTAPVKALPAALTSEPCESCGGICQEDVAGGLARDHTTEDLSYAESPPLGGPHDPCWAPWGPYAEELRPENWVHNLEHGGIVLLYAPDLPAEDLAQLRGFFEGLPPGRALLSPWSASMDLPEARVAAVAWGHRLLLGCVDLLSLQAFFDRWNGKGPEDVLTDPPSNCMDSGSG